VATAGDDGAWRKTLAGPWSGFSEATESDPFELVLTLVLSAVSVISTMTLYIRSTKYKRSLFSFIEATAELLVLHAAQYDA
jgi:hypothetical protein